MPKFKVKIDNDKEFTIKDGFVYEDNLNETLDSTKVVFQTEGETDFEAFDDISIFDDSLVPSIITKEMLVDSGFDEIAYFEPLEGKSYEINIFSRTKWLERFTCPNLSTTKSEVASEKVVLITNSFQVSGSYNEGTKITRILETDYKEVLFQGVQIIMEQREGDYIRNAEIIETFDDGRIAFRIGFDDDPDLIVNGELKYSFQTHSIQQQTNRKFVMEYIENYCSLYLPKVYVQDNENNITFESMYKIASRVRSKFSSIECPEFQWNEPTLREVLTDLMSTANCIPIINSDNEIDYLDITAIGNPIDESKLERIRSTFSSTEACSELTINLKNAIGTSKTRITEYTSLRSLVGEVTTENAILKTQKPIYDIIKITISFPEEFTPNTREFEFREIDITNYVVEKRIWDTLLTARDFDRSAHQYNLKATHLFYTRGNNAIEGWGMTFKMRVFAVVDKTLPIIDWIINDYFNGRITMTEIFYNIDLRDLMVKLEYETISEHSMHVGKYLPSRHCNNRIFDNQSNSYVDIQHQSIYEYAKVNRLGNKIKLLYGIYDNETFIPKLGDYIERNGEKLILFNRKIQYFDNQLVFEGQAIANFVLKDYFTGVMAKKRSWAIAEEKEALDRKEIIKFFLEASFQTKTYKETFIPYNKLLSAFVPYIRGLSIKWTVIETQDKNLNYYPSQTEGYSMETLLEIAGNSLIISLNLYDNFSAGSYSEVIDSVFNNNEYSYVDENGEFVTLYLSFVSSINPSDNDFTWAVINPNYPFTNRLFGDTLREQMIAKGRIKNLVKLEAITEVFSYSKDIYKDNREIISAEFQLEFCSDTPDIVLTNLFWRYCCLYNDDKHTVNDLAVYYSSEETYELTDENAKGSIEGNGSLIVISDNSVTVSIAHTFKSWAICDSNGKIIVAVNSSSVTTIYFNLLATRDRRIYDATTRLPIGNLDNN